MRSFWSACESGITLDPSLVHEVSYGNYGGWNAAYRLIRGLIAKWLLERLSPIDIQNLINVAPSLWAPSVWTRDLDRTRVALLDQIAQGMPYHPKAFFWGLDSSPHL